MEKKKKKKKKRKEKTFPRLGKQLLAVVANCLKK